MGSPLPPTLWSAGGHDALSGSLCWAEGSARHSHLGDKLHPEPGEWDRQVLLPRDKAQTWSLSSSTGWGPSSPGGQLGGITGHRETFLAGTSLRICAREVTSDICQGKTQPPARPHPVAGRVGEAGDRRQARGGGGRSAFQCPLQPVPFAFPHFTGKFGGGTETRRGPTVAGGAAHSSRVRGFRLSHHLVPLTFSGLTSDTPPLTSDPCGYRQTFSQHVVRSGQ